VFGSCLLLTSQNALHATVRVGCFLGRCKILENEAFIEFETARKERAFYRSFYHSFQGFTTFKYFLDINDFDLKAITAIAPPRLVLTAIGELKIVKKFITQIQSCCHLLNSISSISHQMNSESGFLIWKTCSAS
jgi:hypothetical protein